MGKSQEYWRNPPAGHTLAKTEIIIKYFIAWASVVSSASKERKTILYLDLFAGKGRHENGEYSTAIKILEAASRESRLCNILIAILNDEKNIYVREMQEIIESLGLNNKFKYRPLVTNFEVNKTTPPFLSEIARERTFSFIDPYGYRGISMDLIRAVIKDKGSDCLLLFNTSGVRRNLENPGELEHIESIYGVEKLNYLRNEIRRKAQNIGEMLIDEFIKNCLALGVKYIIPFRINFERKRLLSHHLVFMTKHPTGFKIMKDVMAKYSRKENGIPLFEYGNEDYGILDLPGGKMFELKDLLCRNFCRQTVVVGDILDMLNNSGYLYIESNVRNALEILEAEGKIRDTSPSPRRINTFGKKRIVKFL